MMVMMMWPTISSRWGGGCPFNRQSDSVCGFNFFVAYKRLLHKQFSSGDEYGLVLQVLSAAAEFGCKSSIGRPPCGLDQLSFDEHALTIDGETQGHQ